jgi:predicted metalloprotease with PDZ domain
MSRRWPPRGFVLAALAWAGACHGCDLPPAPGKEGDEAAKKKQAPDGDEVTPAEPRLQASDTIEHTVRFDDRQTHHLQVESIVPVEGESLELFMATWTPGSYLIREYARFVEHLSAATIDGQELEARKTRKNRWRVETEGNDRVVIRYRLYARKMSVRTNFVGRDLAVIIGAATFLCPVGGEGLAHDVLLEVPEGMGDSVTGLDAHPDGTPHHYVAESYDVLVDSPLAIGPTVKRKLDVAKAPHYLANVGDGAVWDHERSARDVATLVDAQIDFWGEVPYEDYTFINMLVEAGGGLEHRNSTLMMTSRWATKKREDYVRWLGLVSHEFFHTWNVKRLRPKVLGPFDYEREVYTRSLWVVEGLTSYYDDILLRRAGLLDDEAYLKQLSKQIERVMTTPGRHVQPLAMSSFDAWIKYYRRHAASKDMGVSYYSKGAVVGFLLDAALRRRTEERVTLDDVLREAYDRYSGDEGYTEPEFEALVTELAGESFDPFFERYVHGTAELDFEPAFDYYGLRFAADAPGGGGGTGTGEGAPGTPTEAGSADEEDDEHAYLGVETRDDEPGFVARVVRDSAAYAAGVNVGDELIAMDGYRIEPGSLDKYLERYDPGRDVTLLVVRRGKLEELSVTLGTEPSEDFTIEVDPSASAAERARFEALMSG